MLVMSDLFFRYALICQQCFSHNGMALKEEFEYIGKHKHVYSAAWVRACSQIHIQGSSECNPLYDKMKATTQHRISLLMPMCGLEGIFLVIDKGPCE